MAISSRENRTIYDKIDAFFASKKPAEARMMYAGAALIVGALVYQFVFLETDKNLKQTKTELASIEAKVNDHKRYLSINTQSKLASIKKSVDQKYAEFDDTNYKISYVDNTLTELSYLLFDDENWASFVDNISHLAKKHNVEIKEIANKFFEPTFQKITHVVEIDIKSRANFNNMLKFLNEIEESQLVIDVHGIELAKPTDKVEGTFKIAVWGMKY
jgi:type II secretory pathway component PulM